MIGIIADVGILSHTLTLSVRQREWNSSALYCVHPPPLCVCVCVCVSLSLSVCVCVCLSLSLSPSLPPFLPLFL